MHGPLTVRQIHTKLNSYHLIAYTTILTTSARMEEKGLIERHATSEGYNSALLLQPTVSRPELLTHAVQVVCRNLNATADDRAAALAALSNADV